MRFSNLLVSLCLATSSLAFTFPEGLVDGSYEVSIDARGNEVHRRTDVEGLSFVIPAAKRNLDDVKAAEKRDVIWNGEPGGGDPPEYRCGCGYTTMIPFFGLITLG
jgi:hypothetical protein